MNKTFTILAFAFLTILAGGAGFAAKYFGSISIPPLEEPTAASLEGFSLPEGLRSIEVYADGLPGARALTFAPGGALLVSQTSEGKIAALTDRDGDGKAEATIVAEGLDLPHGMAFRCSDAASPDECDLYVAERSMLSVFSYDAASMKATGRTKLLDLPEGGVGTHFTRSLLFLPHPDGDTLLISVGSSCNVCDEGDSRRAKIWAYDVGTGELSEYARGLRNSVFMELHPVTGEVWATEMGRDGLGDDIPPDEVNIVKKGGNYGWPVCYGKNVHDGDFDTKTYIRNPCMEPLETPSHIDLQAHSAPLGIAFVPEEGWPEDYWFDALVAYHGSWNRSVPTGYKVVRLKLDAKGAYKGTEDFISGWLRPDGTKIGRPVDVKALPGGTLFISDDEAGRVYRVLR